MHTINKCIFPQNYLSPPTTLCYQRGGARESPTHSTAQYTALRQCLGKMENFKLDVVLSRAVDEGVSAWSLLSPFKIGYYQNETDLPINKIDGEIEICE